jgi:hypothetical protein
MRLTVQMQRRSQRRKLLRALSGFLGIAITAWVLYEASVWLRAHSTSIRQSLSSTTATDLPLKRTPLRKLCALGCETHGNCNFEDGRCE